MSEPTVVFDHIAIGVAHLAEAPAVVAGVLGGLPDSGGRGAGFRFACWRFAGGGRLEVLEPAGEDGFLHRFLAARGPGIHHVTFTVPNLAAVCDRAEALGYGVVGRDEADPGWRTAYLHPKQALGIVVQIVETDGSGTPRPWKVPPGPADAPPPVTLVGLRLRAQARERADRQWRDILGARVEAVLSDAVVYRWPGSPMRLLVEVAPAAEEGPCCIEFTADRPVALPAAAIAGLGTTFSPMEV